MATVAVVGGGVIGSAAAAWLLSDGHQVTLFERAPDARPASTGAAGVVAVSEISPLARPGVLAKVPGWLVDPLGPLSLRLRDVPKLTPYLLRYVASARPARVEAATAALAGLTRTAVADHQELARRGGLSGHMHRTGALYVFDSEAGFRSAKAEWEERRRHGVSGETLSADQAREIVPALRGPFERAIYTAEDWMVTSPNAILQALRRRVAATGTIVVDEVAALRPDGRNIAVLTLGGGDLPFDRVVVAGGVWSRDIVRGLGRKVSLETERGYNTTFPNAPFDLPVPIFFSEHGFVASPLAEGVRVGGAVELADVDAPPNFKRAKAMRTRMRRFVPDLPEHGGSEWMGCRPATPDSLPVIGADPEEPRIVYAFGHGHLGVTLSAVTARLIAGLVAGRRDPVLAPLGIERFQ